MDKSLPNKLRRGAAMLEDIRRREHPEMLFTPWYISAMEEAAAELDMIHQTFTGQDLLSMTAKYLGTTPERLRELVRADKEG